MKSGTGMRALTTAVEPLSKVRSCSRKLVKTESFVLVRSERGERRAMNHSKCDEIMDQMSEEIRRLERVIKTYREICSVNLNPNLLDKIEEEAYNNGY